MTYEEYRQHMTAYSRRSAVMSFVQTRNPDFIALTEAGDEIIPWMLQDLVTINTVGNNTIGTICCHAIMTLLWQKVPDPIVVPEDKRGRVQWLEDAWIKWGIEHGYLAPAAPRKWEFFIDHFSLCFGDRSTKKAHTQIGFAIVLLLGWGVYWVLKHL
jgi:hypothetical protein